METRSKESACYLQGQVCLCHLLTKSESGTQILEIQGRLDRIFGKRPQNVSMISFKWRKMMNESPKYSKVVFKNQTLMNAGELD